MAEQEALARMILPGMHRPGKPLGGVMQIHLTRACDLACYSCTQGSNLGGRTTFISLEQFDQACQSLQVYFGIIGIFGGNPCLHPQFDDVCTILRKHFERRRCGLWSNNLHGHGAACRITFNPAVSNLNCHLDKDAYLEMCRDWPEARPFGVDQDSRHCPPFVALRDVIPDEGERWDLISRCDVMLHWSALIGVFRGQLRGWFCEIAGAQSMLHQDEPSYPDTGLQIVSQDGKVDVGWWKCPIEIFAPQVKKHCHECGIPLRGYGQLAQGPETQTEQVSSTHAAIFRPKRRRPLELVTSRDQVYEQGVPRMIDYLQNASR